jgi:uncharacterized protein (UPF0335 family)
VSKTAADFDAEMDSDDEEISVNDRLLAFLEAVEGIESQIDELKAQRSDLYAEAKAVGFDVRIMRIIIRLRRMDEATREEQDELVALYKKAVGL